MARRYWSILRDTGRSRLSRISYVLAGGAGAGVTGLAVVWIYLLVLIPFTPGSKSIERARKQTASTIVSADGQVLARLESLHRDWIPIEQISPFVVDALIATEDHRFYEHDGVDNRRLLSSFFHTVTGDAQGGSTLTMQLARNLYPDRIGNNRSLNRKFKEIVTAHKIERLYSKDEIIETYLNTVPFLYNARGIEMAAHTYFGKKASELTIAESATLVGMLKGTSYYNPIRHAERARLRRNVVLAQMVKHDKLASEEFAAIRDVPVDARLHRQRRPARTADHFVNQVEMQARTWAERNGYDLEADGLTIQTTLNSQLQRFAEQAMRRQGNALQNVANVEWSSPTDRLYSDDIREYAAEARRANSFAYFWRTRTDLVNTFIRETRRYESSKITLSDEAAVTAFRNNRAAMDSLKSAKTRLEGGFVAIEPQTGHILAWVGSRSYLRAPYDHVATARRQPGSTFKPVVYAAALERGYRPDDVVLNDDVNIRIGREQVWTLASDRRDNRDQYVTLRDALAHSRNNITAALMADVGIGRTARLGRKMGIGRSPLVEVPSLALGTSPVTLLEMANVYNTVASGGTSVEPILISAITDESGKTVASFESRGDKVLDEQTAQQLTDMLRSVVDDGTGRRIRYQFGITADVAGKTGTTQNNMDGWFFLMHPDVVAGAWVGFDDPRVTFRSDFWGEGAHNALFVVGDFYREGIRRGDISATARFDAPHLRDIQIAANEGAASDHDASTRSGRSWSTPDFRDMVADIRARLAGLSQSVAAEWRPEYESARNTDPLYAENEASDENADRDEAEMRDRFAVDRSPSRSSGARSRVETRRSDLLDDDRFAVLEEKREEYERLSREFERRLERLRQEPETRELERVIREAYLQERDRNPALRRLEERLGIDLNVGR